MILPWVPKPNRNLKKNKKKKREEKEAMVPSKHDLVLNFRSIWLPFVITKNHAIIDISDRAAFSGLAKQDGLTQHKAQQNMA